jgi:hypothetical protein
MRGMKARKLITMQYLPITEATIHPYDFQNENGQYSLILLHTFMRFWSCRQKGKAKDSLWSSISLFQHVVESYISPTGHVTCLEFPEALLVGAFVQ